jgi:hypothetical protein
MQPQRRTVASTTTCSVAFLNTYTFGNVGAPDALPLAGRVNVVRVGLVVLGPVRELVQIRAVGGRRGRGVILLSRAQEDVARILQEEEKQRLRRQRKERSRSEHPHRHCCVLTGMAVWTSTEPGLVEAQPYTVARSCEILTECRSPLRVWHESGNLPLGHPRMEGQLCVGERQTSERLALSRSNRASSKILSRRHS